MCFVEVKSPVLSMGLPLFYFVTLVANPFSVPYHALFTAGNFLLAAEANMLGDAES